MRSILIYSSEFLPFKGGVARYTADMATVLSDSGFARVVVLTETSNGRGDDDGAHPYRAVRVSTLAGRSGGSTEAVEDGANGLVCDGDDPDDVYRKIRLYHDDLTLRARLRAACRDHVPERFSSEKWRAEY